MKFSSTSTDSVVAAAAVAAPATVLFASMHDSSRGPLAAALFNSFADPTRARACSAGVRPARAPSSLFTAALQDDPLLDLRAYAPRFLSESLLRSADLVIVLGVRGEFVDLGQPCMRWDVPLIETRTPDAVHRIRDEIESLVRRLVRSRQWERTAGQGNAGSG